MFIGLAVGGVIVRCVIVDYDATVGGYAAGDMILRCVFAVDGVILRGALAVDGMTVRGAFAVSDVSFATGYAFTVSGAHVAEARAPRPRPGRPSVERGEQLLLPRRGPESRVCRREGAKRRCNAKRTAPARPAKRRPVKVC